MKILLVEDEEELSDIVARGLRKCGYAVDTAYDGEEAINYYSVYAYDVIVLDLNIPKIEGLAILQNIRQKDKNIDSICSECNRRSCAGIGYGHQ